MIEKIEGFGDIGDRRIGLERVGNFVVSTSRLIVGEYETYIRADGYVVKDRTDGWNPILRFLLAPDFGNSIRYGTESCARAGHDHIVSALKAAMAGELP